MSPAAAASQNAVVPPLPRDHLVAVRKPQQVGEAAAHARDQVLDRALAMGCAHHQGRLGNFLQRLGPDLGRPAAKATVGREQVRWDGCGGRVHREQTDLRRRILYRVPGHEPGRGIGADRGRGLAVASLDGLGEGYGFRKIRRALGVDAFGVNAIVLPPSFETGRHFHDEQEELYFVHSGVVEIEFGDGSRHRLGPGGMARVDAATVRKLANVGDEDAIYVIVGGKDGYVGRDGRLPEGETSRFGGDGPPGA